MEIFVARQPVFTAQKKLFGYELLFRLGLENAFPDIDGTAATSGVLSNTFFSFEFNDISPFQTDEDGNLISKLPGFYLDTVKMADAFFSMT